MVLCSHRDHIRISDLPERVDGCQDCLAAGRAWLHLRICLDCGHVGCCDQSPHGHATAHANASGHPIIRSLEPGEELALVLHRSNRNADPGGNGLHTHPTVATDAIAIQHQRSAQ